MKFSSWGLFKPIGSNQNGLSALRCVFYQEMGNNLIAEMADHGRAVKSRFGPDADLRQCPLQFQDTNGGIDCDRVAMGRDGNIEFRHRQRPKKISSFFKL
jgi:hypothetical protein